MYARSPPPLQHPRPQHPPQQLPSTSPPPPDDALAPSAGIGVGGSTTYQRFSSPSPYGSASATTQTSWHPSNTMNAAAARAGGGVASPNTPLYAPLHAPSAQQQQQHQGFAGHQQSYVPQHQQGMPHIMNGASPPGVGSPVSGPPGAGPSPAPAAGGAGWGGFDPLAMGAAAMSGGSGGAGMGMPFGANDAFSRQALSAGSAYLDAHLSQYAGQLQLRTRYARVKQHFNVSNGYVLRKLRLVLWPWRHRPWSRQVTRNAVTGVVEAYKPPRDDVNSPDLYIPVMALTTYILVAAIHAGSRGLFDPQILGQTLSRSFAVLVLEFVALKLGCYLLGPIGDDGTVLELVAYEGYKFVGIIVALIVDLLGATSTLFWLTFTYCFCANFFFLLRSLRHIILPDPSSSPLDSASASGPGAPAGGGAGAPVSHAQRSRRIQFLFAVALSQGASMLFLVRV